MTEGWAELHHIRIWCIFCLTTAIIYDLLIKQHDIFFASFQTSINCWKRQRYFFMYNSMKAARKFLSDSHVPPLVLFFFLELFWPKSVGPWRSHFPDMSPHKNVPTRPLYWQQLPSHTQKRVLRRSSNNNNNLIANLEEHERERNPNQQQSIERTKRN